MQTIVRIRRKDSSVFQNRSCTATVMNKTVAGPSDVNIWSKCCIIFCYDVLMSKSWLAPATGFKTDTLGHAFLQHSQWQVGAQVAYLFIGLKNDIPFRCPHPVGAQVACLLIGLKGDTPLRHGWSGVVTKEKLEKLQVFSKISKLIKNMKVLS